MRHRAAVALTVAVVALSTVPAAIAVMITTPCGVAVPPGETATLGGDVDCSASAPIVGNNGTILLQRGARLELNGHTIRLVGTAQISPIYCDGSCTVVGPGRITSQVVGAGVFSQKNGRIVVENLSIDTLISGVDAYAARVEVRNVDMSVKRQGIVGRKVVVDDVAIALTGPDPVVCVDARGKGSVKGAGLVLAGCGQFAVAAGRTVVLTNLVSTDGYIGVSSGGRVALVDSSVTGSTFPGGLDIFSRRRPKLVNTVCGRSGRWDDANTGSPVPWGVCSGD